MAELGVPLLLVTVGVPWQPNVRELLAAKAKFGCPALLGVSFQACNAPPVVQKLCSG